MSNPFIAEVRMFAGNFAPRGWALCDGQLLNISGNEALFSLVGTIYGGDGRQTFGLPDLRGRAPVHAGQGPGLTRRNLGARGGSETVVLNPVQMPVHTHEVRAASTPARTSNPSGSVLAETSAPSYTKTGALVPMAAATVANAGGGQSHENMAPYQCVNYIIALQGVYPTRN